MSCCVSALNANFLYETHKRKRGEKPMYYIKRIILSWYCCKYYNEVSIKADFIFTLKSLQLFRHYNNLFILSKLQRFSFMHILII